MELRGNATGCASGAGWAMGVDRLTLLLPESSLHANVKKICILSVLPNESCWKASLISNALADAKIASEIVVSSSFRKGWQRKLPLFEV